MDDLRRPDLQDAGQLQALVVTTLDTLPFALLLVDRDLTVRFVNRTAEELLRREDGLMLRSAGGRRLGTTAPADEDRLREVIEAVAGGDRRSGAVMLGRGRPTDAGPTPSLLVLVQPTAVPDPAGGGPVVLSVTDPETTPVPERRMLADLFKLTAAEAELAESLAAGATIGEVATIRSVRISTVRTQLSSTLRKMGVDRQSSLVALLTHLASQAGQTRKRPRRREPS